MGGSPVEPEKTQEPKEQTPEDETLALQQENSILDSEGHRLRQEWVKIEMTRDSQMLIQGKLEHDQNQRNQAIGRCQAYAKVLERDVHIRQAYEDHIARQDQSEEEQLEGGDYPLKYEASQ